jgi:hypothetical protein
MRCHSPPYSDEQLRDIELWQRRQQFHPRPDYPAEVLEGFAVDWSTLGQRESLAQLVGELAQHGEVDCPNCQHHFYLETDRIEELRHRLAVAHRVVAVRIVSHDHLLWR